MPANKRARRRAFGCRLGVHRIGSLYWLGDRYLGCHDCRVLLLPGTLHTHAEPGYAQLNTRADERDRLDHWRKTGEGPY